MAKARTLGQNVTTADFDTINKYLSIMLDTVATVSSGAFNEGGILSRTRISQQNKLKYAWADIVVYPKNPEFVPVVIPLDCYIIPPHADTLKIGEDIAYPGYVIQVTSTSTTKVGDTLFTGTGNFYLWSISEVGPVIPPSAYNYLQTGWLSPSLDTTWIFLSTNPVLKNSFQGYEIDVKSGGLPRIQQFYNDMLLTGTTGVSDIATETKHGCLFFYPNPTSGLGKITCCDPLCNYSIFDLLGTRLKSGTSEREVDMSDVPAGMYLLKLDQGGKTQRIIKF